MKRHSISLAIGTLIASIILIIIGLALTISIIFIFIGVPVLIVGVLFLVLSILLFIKGTLEGTFSLFGLLFRKKTKKRDKIIDLEEKDGVYEAK